MDEKKFRLDKAKKEYIRTQEPTFLGTAGIFNNKQTYICPCCQSGTGRNRTGLSSVPNKNSYHCFACGESGDVIYFAQKFYKCDFVEALSRLCDYYNITPDTDLTIKKKNDDDLDIDTPLEDQLEFFKKARANLDPSYLEKRGISKETQEHFWVGTVENWSNPHARKNYPTPRCIIPTSRFSYLARDTREGLTDFQKRFSKIKYGSTTMFNVGIKGAKADFVYIVEGEIDSMSIYEATKGYVQAIGLGSTSMWRHLYNEISFAENLQNKTFVLMLDNDAPGQRTQSKIAEMFDMYNIPYIIQEYPKEYNDPNEFLINDRQGFINMLKETYLKTKDKEAEIEI